MALVDIGANLAHDSFDVDRDLVIDRAREAGVASMVITGSDYQSNHDAVELATRDHGLVATSGLHPHHAEAWDNRLADQISQAAANGHIAAVGEAGLDYFRDLSPRQVQIKAFEAQVEIAVEHQLPMFLHQREADADFSDVLASAIKDLPAAVVHCFTADRAALEIYLEMGCHIGITGWICDERRGASVADLLPEIPSGRLMIESDSPYLLPRSLKPKPKSRRNEPSFLPEVARTAAAARGQSVDDLAAETTATATDFFGLAGYPTQAATDAENVTVQV